MFTSIKESIGLLIFPYKSHIFVYKYYPANDWL